MVKANSAVQARDNKPEKRVEKRQHRDIDKIDEKKLILGSKTKNVKKRQIIQAKAKMGKH